MKELWHKYVIEYYSAIRKNKFVSVVVRCMNLETPRQNEVSQKEKNKYCLSMYICGILKDGSDQPICRATIKMQTLRADLWTRGRKKRVGQTESIALKHMHHRTENK